MAPINFSLFKSFCGEGGSRTLVRLAPPAVFETVPFGHSGTSPYNLILTELASGCKKHEKRNEIIYIDSG